jgi:hypothetical protein
VAAQVHSNYDMQALHLNRHPISNKTGRGFKRVNVQEVVAALLSQSGAVRYVREARLAGRAHVSKSAFHRASIHFWNWVKGHTQQLMEQLQGELKRDNKPFDVCIDMGWSVRGAHAPDGLLVVQLKDGRPLSLAHMSKGRWVINKHDNSEVMSDG